MLNDKTRLMLLTDKFSQHSSIFWLVWLNGLVFIDGLIGCTCDSRCCHSTSYYLLYYHNLLAKNYLLSLTIESKRFEGNNNL